MDFRLLVVDVAFLSVVVMATMVCYSYPKPKAESSFENLFTERCNYDTTMLCANCFMEPANCSTFGGRITSESEDMVDIMNQFNEHSIRVTLLNDTEAPVYNYNNLNRGFAIETLRDSVCEELNVTNDCVWRDKEEYIRVLRQRVLDENRFDGAIFCPPWDESGVTRFVEIFYEKHLVTLMLIATNSQSLMVRLLTQHNLPVPYFVMQQGFTLVEYYEGQPLSSFYQSPLPLRLKIANATIDAFLRFNAGIYNFRFYLTNMGPENIFVNLLIREAVEVTFVDLSSVVIIDEISKIHFGSPQTDGCADRYGDMNLHTACQLLLEDRLGDTEKGFLHNTEGDRDLVLVKKMLHHCVYCEAPDCKDRRLILEDIQHLIASVLYDDDI